MTSRRTAWALVAIGLTVVALLAAIALMPRPAAGGAVPTARVARGTLKLDVWAKGDLRAGRVVSLAAPSAGASLRLIHLAGSGSAVRAGDVVMEFDPVDQQYFL